LFRYKKSVSLSYEEQGYIYFTSLRYKQLPADSQELINRLCRECGGEYHRALFDFVTTDVGATAVCNRYFLSQSTLERIVKKYYVAFSESL